MNNEGMLPVASSGPHDRFYNRRSAAISFIRHSTLFIPPSHSKQFCLTSQNGDQAEIVCAPKILSEIGPKPIDYLGTSRSRFQVRP